MLKIENLHVRAGEREILTGLSLTLILAIIMLVAGMKHDGFVNPANRRLVLLALFGGLIFFREGVEALLAAWQTPEYSHGPLIPVLSGILFLRQL